MPTEFVAKRSLLTAAAAAASTLVLSASQALAAFDVVEKTIPQLQQAYSTGQTTAVQVTQQYLGRINQYSFAAGGVNSVAQVNPNLMADAAAVDVLIAGGATTAQYPLLGVPVLIKDAFDVAGQTTTNGVSVLNRTDRPDLKWTDMRAASDAFSVARLRAAGAIIMGKANMSTMAYSFNGIDNAHGVPLNPYQRQRQPGGSSSGSGVSIASNFAMLAMGGETGGSIRIPSNANALVGLKTSLGLIDPGGTWPLTPTRDVVGPMAKSVTDVAIAMNALVAPSSTNLFNGTPFFPTANPGTVRPASYTSSLSTTALQGKVLAVPNSMYNVGTRYEGTVAPTVLNQFNVALNDLRAQGATIVFVDLPAESTYYTTLGANTPTTSGFPYPYPTTTTGGTTPSTAWSTNAAAYYYEKQIEGYNNPTIKNLRDFATALLNGRNGVSGDARSTLNTAYTNINTLANAYEAGLAKGFQDADNNGSPDNPDAIKALQAFNDLRRDQFEAFMANPNLADDPLTAVNESTLKIDSFVAPTYGSVMPIQTAIAPGVTDPYAVSGGASLFGRLEANLLGGPSISVPMGYAPDGTPMGVQFFDEFLGEAKILGFAYDYEQATLWRQAPNLSFVPEPSSAGVLIVLSGMALGVRRRRQPVATPC
jgi:amidase